jgi:hypothetical protein
MRGVAVLGLMLGLTFVWCQRAVVPGSVVLDFVVGVLVVGVLISDMYMYSRRCTQYRVSIRGWTHRY